jgi:uncharacterized membrane protein YcgQ (UPF0703/DUF1980 family)
MTILLYRGQNFFRMFFFTAILIILSTKCFCSINHTFSNDTLSKIQIDSVIKVNSISGFTVKKMKTRDSSYIFNFEKKSGLIFAVSVRSKKDGTILSMFFFNKQLIKLLFRPRKKNKFRTGGVYYFSGDHLFYKEEYNISKYMFSLNPGGLYSYYASFL